MLQFLCNLKILSSFKFGKIRCNMNDHPKRPNWNSKMFLKRQWVIPEIPRDLEKQNGGR